MAEQPTTYDLPDAIAEKLLCSHCKAYVSCGPVKLQPDGTTVCGRCSHANDDDGIPQALFEVAMAKFTFPCRYKQQGCKKRVLFNHAAEHEHECPYHTVCCPSLPYNSCLKDVSVIDIHDHFNEAHTDLILKNAQFKVEFKQDTQCNLLMAEDDVVVIVHYIYDSIKKILHLDVKYFSQDDKKEVYYKLQVISGDNSYSTIHLKERLCDPYESHFFNVQTATNLVMDNYLPVLENPNFIYINVKLTVNIKCSLRNESASSSINITSEAQSVDEYEEKALATWNALENVRCYRCYVFAIPPVFVDEYRGLICRECKNKLKYACSERKIDIKNYPCRWRNCTFMGNGGNIEEHVESCQFRAFICPVASFCDEPYFTLNNVMKHMRQHDGTHCPNPEKVVINLYCGGPSDCDRKVYFTFFENRVIAFTCTISAKYNWYLVGNTENVNIDFYFEHGHCRFKSKTITHKGKMNISYRDYESSYPQCFKLCSGRRISAVLKITNRI